MKNEHSTVIQAALNKAKFDEALDNYMAGVDADSTLKDCAEFMFKAGLDAGSNKSAPFDAKAQSKALVDALLMGAGVTTTYIPESTFREATTKKYPSIALESLVNFVEHITQMPTLQPSPETMFKVLQFLREQAIMHMANYREATKA